MQFLKTRDRTSICASLVVLLFTFIYFCWLPLSTMPSNKYCCVPGCRESGGMHKVLHGFPDPKKARERFNTWIYAIGGEILGLDNAQVSKYRRVCHSHFEDKYLCRNNRISSIAIPKRNLPERKQHIRQTETRQNETDIRQSETDIGKTETDIRQTETIITQTETDTIQSQTDSEDEVLPLKPVECCRCCMTMNNLLPLFEGSLDTMMKKISSLEVTKGDGLPNKICQRCTLRLSSAYSFQQIILKSHETLTQELEKSKNSLTCDKGIQVNTNNTPIEMKKNTSTDLCKEISQLPDTGEVEISENESIHETMIEEYIESDLLESDVEDATVHSENAQTQERKENVPQYDGNTRENVQKQQVSKKNDPKNTLEIPAVTVELELNNESACQTCQIKFDEQNELLEHYKSSFQCLSSVEKKNLCSYCGKTFIWFTSLLKHTRYHTGKNLKTCDVCDKKFSTASAMRKHCLKHQPTTQFQCQECGSSFSQRSSLTRHSHTVHGGRPSLRCSVCYQVFKYTVNLMRHELKVHSKLRCEVCNESFLDLVEFKSHVRVHNLEYDEKSRKLITSFRCQKCEMCFDSKQDLEVHSQQCEVTETVFISMEIEDATVIQPCYIDEIGLI